MGLGDRMKKWNRGIVVVICMAAFLLPSLRVRAAGLTFFDFTPISVTERVIGHTRIGSWNNGQFYETVTKELVGVDHADGKGKYRFRYYVTHKGSHTSYIYQVVPVAIYLNGQQVGQFATTKRTFNKTELWGEKVVTANPGRHLFELKDINVGAITVVNLRTNVDLPYPQFTVLFMDYNGRLLKREKVNSGSDASPPKTPSHEGLSFIGWNGNYKHVNSNRTITAQYNTHVFTINFMDWNHQILKSEQVHYGKRATPPATPSREGFQFLNWDGTYANVTANQNVYARYKANAYTVRFDSHGGSQIPSQSVLHNTRVGKPPNPIKEHHSFQSWLTSTGLVYNFQSLVTSSFVLYAKWDKAPRITANDLTIFENLYTKEEWIHVRMDDVSAQDEEDGDLRSNIQVIQDNVNLETKGEYAITYQVRDRGGNIVEKQIQVNVLDKQAIEDRKHTYVRAISPTFKDRFHPQSKWLLDVAYKRLLEDTWAVTKPKEVWVLDQKDVKAIQEFNRHHGYSKADNEAFLKQFHHLKK